MQAPPEAQDQGFLPSCATGSSARENMVRDNWSSYRIYLVGNYGTDLALRREINRFS